MPTLTDAPIEVQGPRLGYIPEWVMDEAGDTAIHLYVRLTRYADRDGECWPSRATLAEKLRVSVKTIDRTVKELESLGAIEVVRRKDPENARRHLSSIYVLFVDKAGRRIGERGRDTSVARGSDNDGARVGTPMSPKEKPLKKATTSSRRKPETPLPDDFTLTPAMADWAQAEVPNVPLLREFNQFKDHAIAHDRRARDWVAAWRNWMRRADQFARERTAPTKPAGRREWES